MHKTVEVGNDIPMKWAVAVILLLLVCFLSSCISGPGNDHYRKTMQASYARESVNAQARGNR